MPRHARKLSDGHVYHVINRGNDGKNIFYDDDDYRFFIGLMKESLALLPVRIYAYCLMPDHVHFLLLPEKGSDMSRWIHRIMTGYVRYFHRRYDACGKIWQGRFKSFIVQKGDHLLNMASFIESNPLRRGLVGSAGEWKWSSHMENAGKEKQMITERILVEYAKDWGDFVNTSLMPGECERIHLSLKRQFPYGSRMWNEQVCKELGIKLSKRKRGRPRKDSSCSNMSPI